jgi:hypothetical protein
MQCDAALSDRVLQAARAAVPADAGQAFRNAANGPRNEPLLPLLIALLDATKVVASACADNAWDDCRPIDRQLTTDLARQAKAIAADITNASDCPDASGWSLPSMSGKELV